MVDLEHELTLFRLYKTNYGIFGRLSYLGSDLCDTLEPCLDDNFRNHAICEGTYPLELTYSPKFGDVRPLLSVPNRSGIRIHEGNFKKDTQGCILVGLRHNYLLEKSRYKVNELIELIRKNNICSICVTNLYDNPLQLHLDYDR